MIRVDFMVSPKLFLIFKIRYSENLTNFSGDPPNLILSLQINSREI